jgi:hypothetical protein
MIVVSARTNKSRHHHHHTPTHRPTSPTTTDCVGRLMAVRQQPARNEGSIVACFAAVRKLRKEGINHTCNSDFDNCKFLQTEITKDPRVGEREDDGGGVRGRRTSVVFVQATRRVERDEEFFATTGRASCFLMRVSVI